MCGTFTLIMHFINNCDELLDFLYQLSLDYHSSNGDSYTFFDSFYINFQGDECKVSVHHGTEDWTEFMPSNKHPKTVFGIVDYGTGYGAKTILLNIYQGDSFILGEAIGIELPACIQDELTATIKGHW